MGVLTDGRMQLANDSGNPSLFCSPPARAMHNGCIYNVYDDAV